MENFAKIFDNVEKLGKHRREMNRIIVQEISDEEKLTQIRKSILKFNAGSEDTETSANTEDELKQFFETGINKDELKQLFTTDLETVNEMLQTMTTPFKQHRSLVDSVKAVLLGQLTPSEKVEQIENLLM